MKSVFEYLITSRQSTDVKLSSQTVRDIISHRVPLIWKSSDIPMGSTDKVFASKWLDARRVICGTKCNQVFVMYKLITIERFSYEGETYGTFTAHTLYDVLYHRNGFPLSFQ